MPLLRLREDRDRRFLTTFVVGWTVLFGGLGALAASRGQVVLAWCLVGVAGLGLPGLFSLVPAEWLYHGWTTLLAPFAWVVSIILLTLVYLLVITPIALVLRLTGRDPLARQPDPNATTYWSPRTASPDAERYFRQS